MKEVIKDYKSSQENLREVEWVKQQVKQDLADFKNEIAKNVSAVHMPLEFYHIDNGKVKYSADVVYQRLSPRRELKEKRIDVNSTTTIMAVQIALEMQGYDVGKIDGFLWDNTKTAVKEFQKTRNSTHTTGKLKVDGIPSSKTINAIFESWTNTK